MKIGSFEVYYISHVCFIFKTLSGQILITDPFFGAGFFWNGHYEKYLSPPDIKISEIKKCDVVFVSHIHPDHYDPVAVMSILSTTNARVIAPADVIDDLISKGADKKSLVAANEGERFEFSDLEVSVFCGYDDSFDKKGRPNKFSLVLENASTAFFYSGDCHSLPPAVLGRRFNAIFCWSMCDNETKIRGLCEDIKTSKFVMMHGDRFEPGNFFCNRDMEKDKNIMQKLFPDLEIIIPNRISKL